VANRSMSAAQFAARDLVAGGAATGRIVMQQREPKREDCKIAIRLIIARPGWLFAFFQRYLTTSTIFVHVAAGMGPASARAPPSLRILVRLGG
jgi:hypothetical protein